MFVSPNLTLRATTNAPDSSNTEEEPVALAFGTVKTTAAARYVKSFFMRVLLKF